MGYVSASRYSIRNRRKGSRYKVGSRKKLVFRPAGAYRTLRSTRFAPLRLAAKAAKNPVRISRGLSPFPNTKVVRHKYCDIIQLPAAAVAGAYRYYQFRANSTFDPDYTGVGHQPMFRDEMAAQYNYYTCIGSYIKFTIPPEQTTAQTFMLWVDDEVTLPATFNDAAEQHRHYASLKLDKRNAPLKLRASYNAAKWNKTTLSGLMADDQQKVAVGSNPSSVAVKYFTLYSAPNSTSDTLAAINVHVELIQIVMWREPKDHTGS